MKRLTNTVPVSLQRHSVSYCICI